MHCQILLNDFCMPSIVAGLPIHKGIRFARARKRDRESKNAAKSAPSPAASSSRPGGVKANQSFPGGTENS
jgi:hypothetical protein